MTTSQIWHFRNMQELFRDSDYGSKHKQDPSVIQAPFEFSLRVLLVPIELNLQECVFVWTVSFTHSFVFWRLSVLGIVHLLGFSACYDLNFMVSCVQFCIRLQIAS